MAGDRISHANGLFGSLFQGVRINPGDRGNAPTRRDIKETPLLRNMDAVIVTLTGGVADVTDLQDELHLNTERRFIALHVLDSTHLLILFAQ